MPDSIKSLGEPMAPAVTITSRSARSSSVRPLTMISTPMARPFSTTMRLTVASARNVRFLRPSAGLR